MILDLQWQWEKVLGHQSWQHRCVTAMGGEMLHVEPAFCCTGEALRAHVMLISHPAGLWSMLWLVEICL